MTGGRRLRSVGRGLGLVLLLCLGACEPSGPGPLTAIVTTPGPTGALVVEVVGTGITGFDGVGDVRTLEAPLAAGDSTRRVVVVSPSGAGLRFSVMVEDVSAPFPRAVVISAVDASNQPISSLTGYSIGISR